MSTSKAEGVELLYGVSLPALARVHAAERAGVPVEERLAEMGLDRAAFSKAEQAWSERLSCSLREDPALFVAYDTALSEALSEDAPRLVPLEDDLGAWVSFEGHFQRALDPAEVAVKVGLTLAEVARLHRIWAERLAGDPVLAEEAVRKRAEEPAPLPEVKREPRVARRAVVGELVAPRAAPEAAAAAVPGASLPDAPLRSMPAAPPVTPQWNTPVLQPAEAPPTPGAPTPMGSGTTDINLAALFKGQLPFDPNAPRAPGPASPPPPPRAAPFTGTSAVDVSQLRAGAVPFSPGVASANAHSVNSTPERSTQPSTETTELDLRAMFGAGAPLPFQQGGARDSRAPQVGATAAPGRAPAAPQDERPGKVRPFESETTEVDPALIAAALKKGPAPFKK